MKNAKFIKLYADFLSRSIRIERPLKVVFDCSNGTAGPTIQKLKIKNLKLKIINEIPDGNFPAHGPDPLKRLAIYDLRSAVLKRKADLGVIFDADADRVFFIDNRGRFVDPDAIARLLIWQLKPKKVIIDVRTGWLIKKFKIQNSPKQMLRIATGQAKFKISISKVGHYFIEKLMRKDKADLGVERSGHYYFKDFFYADAAILAAIHIINAVSKLPYSLADFVDLLPRYYRKGEINIRHQIPGVRCQELFKKIEKSLKAKNYKLKARVSRLDGLTMEFDNWWFNLRPSNTEPLIRLSIESDSKRILIRQRKQLTKLINSDIN